VTTPLHSIQPHCGKRMESATMIRKQPATMKNRPLPQGPRVLLTRFAFALVPYFPSLLHKAP
jgi:hypothetical protein